MSYTLEAQVSASRLGPSEPIVRRSELRVDHSVERKFSAVEAQVGPSGKPRIVETRQESTRPATALGACVSQYFEELRTPVYGYALTICRQPETAEDITQEVFLRLYSHLAAGNQLGNVKAWVFRVCHNLAVNEMRRATPAPTAAQNLEDGDSDEEIATVEPDPERQVLEKERSTRLLRGVRSLTDHQRRCLYLRAEGFRYREIAAQLNISISSVVETLARAVEHLKKTDDAPF